jgi:hypothetical protein
VDAGGEEGGAEMKHQGGCEECDGLYFPEWLLWIDHEKEKKDREDFSRQTKREWNDLLKMNEMLQGKGTDKAGFREGSIVTNYVIVPAQTGPFNKVEDLLIDSARQVGCDKFSSGRSRDKKGNCILGVFSFAADATTQQKFRTEVIGAFKNAGLDYEAVDDGSEGNWKLVRPVETTQISEKRANL